jgi:hypothetical protein
MQKNTDLNHYLNQYFFNPYKPPAYSWSVPRHSMGQAFDGVALVDSWHGHSLHKGL